MDDSQIIKYLNNLNIITLGIIRVFEVTSNCVYRFQGKTYSHELVEGSIELNIDGIDVKYITQSGEQHLFSCKLFYLNANNYEVNTSHATLEDGKLNIINSTNTINTPKSEFFKDIFDTTNKLTTPEKQKTYSLNFSAIY